MGREFIAMKFFRKIALFGSVVSMILGVGSAVEAASIVVGTENNVLNFIDTNTLSTTNSIGVTGTNGVLTDVAFNQNGTLYGITFGELYTINKNTGVASLVGNLGGLGFNALVINASGQAFSATNNGGDLFQVNLSTGAASSLGTIGNGFDSSSGDLEFANGTLFGVDGNNGTDRLYSITTGPVTGTDIGSTGLSQLFGLAFAEGVMFGFSGQSSDLLSVNLITGLASSLGAISGFTGGNGVFGASTVVSVVPLPAALPLYGTGLALMGFVGWRRRRKQLHS